MSAPIQADVSRPGWLSVYLYLRAGSDAPATSTSLGSFVAAVNGSGDRSWFYVRYNDWLGAHLRLRLAVRSHGERQALLATIAKLLGVSVAGALGRRGAQIRDRRFGRIRVVAYRPEVNRYGGHRLLPVSEEFFVQSSKWVLGLRYLVAANYAARVTTAAACAVILIRRCGLQGEAQQGMLRRMVEVHVRKLETQDFLDRRQLLYGLAGHWEASAANYRRFFSQVEAGAAAPPLDRESLLAWDAQCRRLIGAVTAVGHRRGATVPEARFARIVISWIHMHSNRLGIRNREEAAVAFCLQRYFNTPIEGADSRINSKNGLI